jgi:hypothetical protein
VANGNHNRVYGRVPNDVICGRTFRKVSPSGGRRRSQEVAIYRAFGWGNYERAWWIRMRFASLDRKRASAHARRCFNARRRVLECCAQMAHPTRFERVTFAFGGHGSNNGPCLNESPSNCRRRVEWKRAGAIAASSRAGHAATHRQLDARKHRRPHFAPSRAGSHLPKIRLSNLDGPLAERIRSAISGLLWPPDGILGEAPPPYWHGFFRPHRGGFFGRGRYRDLDDDRLTDRCRRETIRRVWSLATSGKHLLAASISHF